MLFVSVSSYAGVRSRGRGPRDGGVPTAVVRLHHHVVLDEGGAEDEEACPALIQAAHLHRLFEGGAALIHVLRVQHLKQKDR